MKTDTPEFFEVFPWNKNFETGITEIDEQHKKLIHLLNQLAAHLANKSTLPTLNQVFGELADYAHYHFSAEEKIWHASFENDPWLEKHLRSHSGFISKINELKGEQSTKSTDELVEDIVRFLTHWLALHILDTDRHMAIAVLELRGGLSIDQAKKVADEKMSGTMKVLVDTVLSMYENLSSRTLDLMREKVERKRMQEALIASELQKQESDKLLISMEQTVRAMVAAIEIRSPYTGGHQQRVADLAKAIAREMMLPESEIHGVYLAATVHDIGEFQIPSEILVKPGKLTSIEYQLIQQHPQAGYDILKGIDFPWPIAQIVYQHHERLDGSGYPRGLKGDEILTGAKILVVSEVLEAMTSHRPYRASVGIEAALEEIIKNKGILYDNAVVDACVKLFKENAFAFSH